MTRERAVDLVLTPVLCLAGSVLAGAMVYGNRVFNPEMAHFQFVVSGLIGGSLVLAIQFRRGQYAILGCVAAFLIMSILVGSPAPDILARNALWVLGLYLAVRSGLLIDDKIRRVAVGKFTLWAATFGIVHVCMFAILSVARRGSVEAELALFQLTLGALIGAGVGLGHEIAEMVKFRRILRAQ